MRGCILPVFLVQMFADQPASANPLMESPVFRQMQEDGFAHASALAFASIAEAAGDISAGIGALEQSLAQNGADTQLHARLADLYARIGNEGLALHHADLAGTTIEPERSQIWGRVGLGIAHDSNPTAAESNAEIRIFDAQSNSFLNFSARAEEPDTLATVSLDLGVDHRLSEEAILAAELSLRGEKYFDIDALDNLTGTFAIGPWLGPGETLAGDVWVRPYASVSGAMLDGEHYYTSYGGGMDLRFSIGPEMQAAIGATVLRTDYNGRISPDFDTNTLDNTALLLSVGLSGEGPLDATYSVRASGTALEASRSSESYLHVGLDAGVSVPITAFGALTGVPLALRLGGSVDQFRYTNVDPEIDPTRRRSDLWFGGRSSLVLTVAEDVDLIFGADYLRQMSNIAAFETDNLRIYSELGVNF